MVTSASLKKVWYGDFNYYIIFWNGEGCDRKRDYSVHGPYYVARLLVHVVKLGCGGGVSWKLSHLLPIRPALQGFIPIASVILFIGHFVAFDWFGDRLVGKYGPYAWIGDAGCISLFMGSMGAFALRATRGSLGEVRNLFSHFDLFKALKVVPLAGGNLLVLGVGAVLTAGWSAEVVTELPDKDELYG
jgi:hypothetical protein